MTLKQTRAIIEPYAASHDPACIAENAVFIDMGTGERHEGREAIAGMLHWIYHVAFDATAEDVRLIIGEGKATLEANFVGVHIGEFAGIEATGRSVRVPLCVTYNVAEHGITEARVYMMAGVMMQQLGAMEATEAG